MTPSSITTSTTRPLNLMSDPRIFRGSVIAKKREEIIKIQKEIEIIDAEERYRMEVVRNRLNMALGINGVPGGTKYYKINNIRAETSARLAKLAGKTGKIAINEWNNQENGIEKVSPRKSPKKIHPPRKLSPIKIDKINKQISTVKIYETSYIRSKNDLFFKSKKDIKNVKFVPLKDDKTMTTSKTTNGLHKIVPSFPKYTEKHPRKLIQYKKLNQLPGTPPQSPYGPKYYNDACVQTDEAFEEAFNPIVEEIADTALNNALRNLREEEDFKFIEKQNEKLLDIVVTQKRRNSELNMTILKHIRNEHEIDKERQLAYRKLLAIECHELALKFTDQLIINSEEMLANRGLINDTAKYRSIAIDTRQLQQQQKELQEIAAEIERDFLPYVYAKAEQIFVHKLADSYLKDALFCKNPHSRAEARVKLNDQIQKYQKLTRGHILKDYHQTNKIY